MLEGLFAFIFGVLCLSVGYRAWMLSGERKTVLSTILGIGGVSLMIVGLTRMVLQTLGGCIG